MTLSADVTLESSSGSFTALTESPAYYPKPEILLYLPGLYAISSDPKGIHSDGTDCMVSVNSLLTLLVVLNYYFLLTLVGCLFPFLLGYTEYARFDDVCYDCLHAASILFCCLMVRESRYFGLVCMGPLFFTFVLTAYRLVSSSSDWLLSSSRWLRDE